jgi:hypothetical protein
VFISFSKNFFHRLPKFSKNPKLVSKKKRFQENLLLDQVVFEAKVEENTTEHEKKESPIWEKISLIFSKSRRGIPPARAATASQ